jgi:hypothetical protein
LRFLVGEIAGAALTQPAQLPGATCSTLWLTRNFKEAAVTFHDYTAYEREVLHELASIRWACWLMATAVAGGAVPFGILALLGF